MENLGTIKLQVFRGTIKLEVWLETFIVKRPDKDKYDCYNLGTSRCANIDGETGVKGHRGNRGGNAGLPGKELLILMNDT